MSLFTTQQVQSAWASLPTTIRDTPFRRAKTKGLFLKLETLQPTGSYKIRAAFYRLSQRDKTAKGVALSSSGNFASAFTWAASQFQVPAHLVVTPTVNSRKMEIAREHPVEVHTCGPTYESRFETLEKLAADGLESIDHRTCERVFLGHATIGWECLCYASEFERVLIPVSTGGLALGVAAALRAGGFQGEILGVQPKGNPTLFKSWQKGEPVQRQGIDTVCDALTATSIPASTFKQLQEHLDGILLVKEESVMKAVGYLALNEGVVAEPGACVGLAALLEGQRPWEKSACILTGRNLTATMLKAGIDEWSKARQFHG